MHKNRILVFQNQKRFVFILDESFWKFSLTKNQFIYDSVQELNRKLGGRILWFHCSKAKMLETVFILNKN